MRLKKLNALVVSAALSLLLLPACGDKHSSGVLLGQSGHCRVALLESREKADQRNPTTETETFDYWLDAEDELITSWECVREQVVAEDCLEPDSELCTTSKKRHSETP